MANSNYNKANNRNNMAHLYQKLVWSLNVLNKSVLMYPENHVTIENSLKRSFKLLNALFIDISSISFSMGKDKLLVNEKSVEKHSQHTDDFSHFFRSRGIASVTILKDVSLDEMRIFFNLLSKIPFRSHVENHGDIHRQLKSFSNISIREMDLRDVKFTDEEVIGASKPHSGVATVWQEFILNCMLQGHKQTKAIFSVEAVALGARDSFNDFLEKYNVSNEQVGGSYKKILEKHFISQEENPVKLSGREEFFNLIGNIFQDLDDQIKVQILSSTFESIARLSEGEKLQDFPGHMQGNIFVALVEWVRTGSSNLSPTIIKLLNMLPWNDMMNSVDDWVGNEEVPWDDLEELFSKRAYDQYVPEDYADQLLNIPLANNDQDGKEAILPTADFVRALQDDSVNCHIANALLALMQGPLDEQVYIDYAGNIYHLLTDLLKAGEYEMLLNILDFFTDDLKNPDKEVTSKAAKSVVDRFSDDQFIKTISEVFSAQKGENNQYLDELIFRNGSENLDWLIEQYLEQDLFDGSSRIFRVLKRFGPETCKRAAYRLPGENRDQTILLLKLINNCDDDNSAIQVRKLLNSKDLDIRLEAIKTLMSQKDSAALAALKKLAFSKNRMIRYKAYDIIHHYTIIELSPALTKTIKTVFISKSTLASNKTVLSLLGSFREPAILPDLKRIAFSKFSFTPSKFKKTQEFLYEILSTYPQENVKEFIEIGVKSKNSKIKSICKEMLGNGQ